MFSEAKQKRHKLILKLYPFIKGKSKQLSSTQLLIIVDDIMITLQEAWWIVKAAINIDKYIEDDELNKADMYKDAPSCILNGPY